MVWWIWAVAQRFGTDLMSQGPGRQRKAVYRYDRPDTSMHPQPGGC